MSKRYFIDTLRELEAGELVEDLTDAQHAVVTAVESRGGTGELTLKLKFKMEGRQMQVKADVVSKLPKGTRGSSLFFITPEGNLERNGPSQRKLALRDVDEPKQPLKEAN